VILDFIAGDLWIWGVHIVATFTSLSKEPAFPIARPGFFVSIITILLWGSKIIWEISASVGIISLIFCFVNSWSIRRDLSDLSSILFLIVFTASFIAESPFLKNAASEV